MKAIPQSIVFASTVLLAACVSSKVQVGVARTNADTFAISVVERTRDPFRHRPARWEYHFTAPIRPVVAASELSNFIARYSGSDGTIESYRAPVAGYVSFQGYPKLNLVEFRLVEHSDCACHHLWPLTINGRHPVSPMNTAASVPSDRY